MKTDKTRIPLTTVPQAPQLLGSVFGSVQTPSHSTWPGGHAGSWQRPAVQTSPSSHWWTVIYVYISMTGRRTYHIAAPPAVCRIIEDILTHSITALPVRWALVTSPKHRCSEDEAIAWICCLPQYRMPRKRRGMSGHGCRRRCSRHHPEDTAGKKRTQIRLHPSRQQVSGHTTIPQSPQLLGSVAGSTQAPLHSKSGGRQMKRHAPPIQSGVSGGHYQYGRG